MDVTQPAVDMYKGKLLIDTCNILRFWNPLAAIMSLSSHCLLLRQPPSLSGDFIYVYPTELPVVEAKLPHDFFYPFVVYDSADSSANSAAAVVIGTLPFLVFSCCVMLSVN